MLGNFVYIEFFNFEVEVGMGYIELVCWVDLFLVVFVSCNIIVKFVVGLVDDLFFILYLVIKVFVWVVLVMN